MSEKSIPEFPFKSLGNSLKALREKRRKSLAEVSGAVEIDIEELGHFEYGAKRPPEEILTLLINYFDITDDEADKLWELAGYSRENNDQSWSGDESVAKQTVIVLPQETRIMYTDMIHTAANNFGVVINFMQSNGPNNQPLVVSRLGMSKEHARSLIEVLQKTLYAAEPKQLPSPSKSNPQNQKHKN